MFTEFTLLSNAPYNVSYTSPNSQMSTTFLMVCFTSPGFPKLHYNEHSQDLLFFWEFKKIFYTCTGFRMVSTLPQIHWSSSSHVHHVFQALPISQVFATFSMTSALLHGHCSSKQSPSFLMLSKIVCVPYSFLYFPRAFLCFSRFCGVHYSPPWFLHFSMFNVASSTSQSFQGSPRVPHGFLHVSMFTRVSNTILSSLRFQHFLERLKVCFTSPKVSYTSRLSCCIPKFPALLSVQHGFLHPSIVSALPHTYYSSLSFPMSLMVSYTPSIHQVCSTSWFNFISHILPCSPMVPTLQIPDSLLLFLKHLMVSPTLHSSVGFPATRVHISYSSMSSQQDKKEPPGQTKSWSASSSKICATASHVGQVQHTGPARILNLYRDATYRYKDPSL